MFSYITSVGNLFALEVHIPEYSYLITKINNINFDKISTNEKNQLILEILKHLGLSDIVSNNKLSNIEQLLIESKLYLLNELADIVPEGSILKTYIGLNNITLKLREELRRKFQSSQRLSISEIQISIDSSNINDELVIGLVQENLKEYSSQELSTLNQVEDTIDKLYYDILLSLIPRMSSVFRYFLKLELESKLQELLSRNDSFGNQNLVNMIPSDLINVLDLETSLIVDNDPSDTNSKNNFILSYVNSAEYTPDHELKSLQIYKKIVFLFYNLQLVYNTSSWTDINENLVNYDYI